MIPTLPLFILISLVRQISQHTGMQILGRSRTWTSVRHNCTFGLRLSSLYSRTHEDLQLELTGLVGNPIPLTLLTITSDSSPRQPAIQPPSQMPPPRSPTNKLHSQYQPQSRTFPTESHPSDLRVQPHYPHLQVHSPPYPSPPQPVTQHCSGHYLWRTRPRARA